MMTTLVVLLLSGVGLLMADDANKPDKKTCPCPGCQTRRVSPGTEVVQPTLTVKEVSPCGSILKADMTTCYGKKHTITFEANPGPTPAAADALKEQIRNLKTGSDVTVIYFKDPESKKLIVTKVVPEDSDKK
ncbi:MAG: hypothetical protein AB1696_19040 [Planctomycetota bacterium]